IPSLYQVLEGIQPAQTPAVRVVSEPGKYRKAENLWVVSYIVLEQLLEDVAQKSFPQIASDLLFSPLGLKNTTFEQPLPENLWPQTSWGHQTKRIIHGAAHVYPTRAAMGLWTSPTDLAHILIEIMKSYRGLSTLIVSQNTVKQLIDLDNPYFQWYSNGGGYYCFYAFDARVGQGIVIMINHEAGHDLRREITHSFFQAWKWRWGNFILTDRLIFSGMIYAALVFFVLIIFLGGVLFIRQSRRKL
ncbi:serine hydrolase, partial [Acidobacteriota bacterium]